MRSAVSVCALALLLVACPFGLGGGGGGGDFRPLMASCLEARDNDPFDLRIGAFDSWIRPFAPGEELSIEYGFQGGQHTYVSVAALINEERGLLVRAVSGGSEISRVQQQLTPCADGRVALLENLRLVLPQEHFAEAVILEAELRDLSGSIVSSATAVVSIMGP